ncbi:hypothetical protein J8273_6665 [Carpediemonas membranifera]|uniref:Uncharacterized protein n=1 Tax=Carpediemonas membranifera TaxID=201153 RepID=A0A8J6B164_9EUKA|nr:hypothetical protein J8273_6665 [Carpediemonas membranifera]|eukprot:KAG9392074.1 hypothetical protein J8273_6665 [Carpediemonas membranifera]
MFKGFGNISLQMSSVTDNGSTESSPTAKKEDPRLLLFSEEQKPKASFEDLFGNIAIVKPRLKPEQPPEEPKPEPRKDDVAPPEASHRGFEMFSSKQDGTKIASNAEVQKKVKERRPVSKKARSPKETKETSPKPAAVKKEACKAKSEPKSPSTPPPPAAKPLEESPQARAQGYVDRLTDKAPATKRKQAGDSRTPVKRDYAKPMMQLQAVAGVPSDDAIARGTKRLTAAGGVEYAISCKDKTVTVVDPTRDTAKSEIWSIGERQEAQVLFFNNYDASSCAALEKFLDMTHADHAETPTDYVTPFIPPQDGSVTFPHYDPPSVKCICSWAFHFELGKMVYCTVCGRACHRECYELNAEFDDSSFRCVYCDRSLLKSGIYSLGFKKYVECNIQTIGAEGETVSESMHDLLPLGLSREPETSVEAIIDSCQHRCDEELKMFNKYIEEEED